MHIVICNVWLLTLFNVMLFVSSEDVSSIRIHMFNDEATSEPKWPKTTGYVYFTLWFDSKMYHANVYVDGTAQQRYYQITQFDVTNCANIQETQIMIENDNSNGWFLIDKIDFTTSSGIWYGLDAYCGQTNAYPSAMEGNWQTDVSQCTTGGSRFRNYGVICVDTSNCDYRLEVLTFDTTMQNEYILTAGWSHTTSPEACAQTNVPTSTELPPSATTNQPSISNAPTGSPVRTATTQPSYTPTMPPSSTVTHQPSYTPSELPSHGATYSPSNTPTWFPVSTPPSYIQSTKEPTAYPFRAPLPSESPWTASPIQSTLIPTVLPSASPSLHSFITSTVEPEIKDFSTQSKAKDTLDQLTIILVVIFVLVCLIVVIGNSIWCVYVRGRQKTINSKINMMHVNHVNNGNAVLAVTKGRWEDDHSDNNNQPLEKITAEDIHDGAEDNGNMNGVRANDVSDVQCRAKAAGPRREGSIVFKGNQTTRDDEENINIDADAFIVKGHDEFIQQMDVQNIVIDRDEFVIQGDDELHDTTK